MEKVRGFATMVRIRIELASVRSWPLADKDNDEVQLAHEAKKCFGDAKKGLLIADKRVWRDLIEKRICEYVYHIDKR